MHKGRTPDSGHYFMLRVHPQDPNKFYKVNDSVISMIHGDVDVCEGYLYSYVKCDEQTTGATQNYSIR